MSDLQLVKKQTGLNVPSKLLFKSCSINIAITKIKKDIPYLKNISLCNTDRLIYPIYYKKIYKYLYKFLNCVKSSLKESGYDHENSIIKTVYVEKSYAKFAFRYHAKGKCSRNKIYMSRIALEVKPSLKQEI